MKRYGCVCALLCAVDTASAQITEGLIAHWPADGTAVDVVGGHDGTLQNGATYAPGRIGQAFSFDGTNHVLVPASAELDFLPGSQYTVTMWFYRTGGETVQHFLGNRVGCGECCPFVQACMCPGGHPSGSIPLNEWVFIAYVAEGDANRQYVNDTIVNGGPGQLPTAQSGEDWTLGNSGSCAGVVGLLDDIKIYDRALSHWEVKTLASCTPPIAWWRGEGNAEDSARQHHGTLVNGAGYAPGLCGQAFDLRGPGYVEIPESADIDFQPGDSYSIVLWAYRTASSLYHFIGKRVGCGGGSDFLQVVVDQSYENDAIPLNQWVMVAQSADGESNHFLCLTANGVVLTEGPGTLPAGQNDAPWRIGTSGDCEDFNGYIDEVMIFDRALSIPELEDIYANACQVPCIPELQPLAQELDLNPGASSFFKVHTQPGEIVTVELRGSPGNLDRNQVYARWGALPGESAFDLASLDPDADQRLIIPFARGGTYYVRVQAPFASVDSHVSISATIGSLGLDRITASCDGGCSGVVSVAAQGGGFEEAVIFALEGPGGNRVNAEEALVLSSDRAELRFDLSGQSSGLYAVVAERGGDMAKLEDALLVNTSVIGPRLAAELSMPPFYRAELPRRATLRSRNTGDVEMHAPLYLIQGTPGTAFWLHNGEEPSASLQVLGLHPGGIPCRLPAGEAGELPILFRNDLPPGSIDITAGRLSATAEDLVGWGQVEPPRGVSEESWSVVRPELERTLGPSWLEVEAALGRIAGRLARRGKLVASVLELFRFAYAEAAGHPASAITGVARDADGNPAPGLLLGAMSLGGGDILACGTADVDGAFAIAPLPPGEYEIVTRMRSSEAETVIIEEGKDVHGVQVLLGGSSLLMFDCPPLADLELPEEPLPIPERLLEVAATGRATVVLAIDPNEKEGPGEGIGVQPGSEIIYTVYFENKASSTAATRRVEIVDDLDPVFDLGTFRFLDLQVGGRLDPIDTAGGMGLTSGYTLLTNGERLSLETQDARQVHYPDPAVPVNLTLTTKAFVDPVSRRATWVAEAGDLSSESDPREGFLPPNDGTHRGEGFVSFRVRLSVSATPGRQVENSASIRFDSQEVLVTSPISFFVVSGPIRFIRGDVNADSRIDISDPVSLLNFLFQGGAAPGCLDAADANDSGGDMPDISDAIHILAWLFQGAPSVSLTETCAEDLPSPSDMIPCATPHACP